MGRLMVLEGLDGSGKATQTGLLQKTLAGRGEKVRAVSFPNYAGRASEPVKMYLEGAFGSDPEAVNAYAASAFYAVDRYASWKIQLEPFYEDGGLLLADRYTTSNIIHQCSKLKRGEWPGFVDWLEDFEYRKMGIPAPDLVLYLDVEPEVSARLIALRGEGRDIHEADLDYLKRCRAVADWCIEAKGWRRIACTKNGEMLPKEQILKAILQGMEEML